jgi:hypothetical protein
MRQVEDEYSSSREQDQAENTIASSPSKAKLVSTDQFVPSPLDKTMNRGIKKNDDEI